MVEFYVYGGINYPKDLMDKLVRSYGSNATYAGKSISKFKPVRRSKKNAMLLHGPTPEKVYRSKPVPKFKSFRKASPKVIYRANDNR